MGRTRAIYRPTTNNGAKRQYLVGGADRMSGRSNQSVPREARASSDLPASVPPNLWPFLQFSTSKLLTYRLLLLLCNTLPVATCSAKWTKKILLARTWKDKRLCSTIPRTGLLQNNCWNVGGSADMPFEAVLLEGMQPVSREDKVEFPGRRVMAIWVTPARFDYNVWRRAVGRWLGKYCFLGYLLLSQLMLTH